MTTVILSSTRCPQLSRCCPKRRDCPTRSPGRSRTDSSRNCPHALQTRILSLDGIGLCAGQRGCSLEVIGSRLFAPSLSVERTCWLDGVRHAREFARSRRSSPVVSNSTTRSQRNGQSWPSPNLIQSGRASLHGRRLRLASTGRKWLPLPSCVGATSTRLLERWQRARMAIQRR
jgi:hypothetical protein